MYEEDEGNIDRGLISVDLIRYLAHIRAQMTLFYLKI
jgi:hypothetical protein